MKALLYFLNLNCRRFNKHRVLQPPKYLLYSFPPISVSFFVCLVKCVAGLTLTLMKAVSSLILVSIWLVHYSQTWSPKTVLSIVVVCIAACLCSTVKSIVTFSISSFCICANFYSLFLLLLL